MALTDLSALAERFGDDADAAADESFNEQHDLARRELAAVESVEAAGRERWRRDQIARAAAAAAASGDGGARFGPLDDDEPEVARLGTPPSGSAGRSRGAAETDAADDDDDEEAQQTWLR